MHARLLEMGANEHFVGALVSLRRPELRLARVLKAMKRHCDVWTEGGEESVRIPKRVFRASLGAPVVGDWVAIVAGKMEGELGTIAAVLPRQTNLARRAVGRQATSQQVAANVDTAFVMVGLDGDFNLRRIERYLAVAWQGNVQPVVLLNKIDLHPAPDSMQREVQQVALGAPVHGISVKRSLGLEALTPHLAPCRTVVVLGSSGVGKSTLVNHLLGYDRMATQTVRARDDRGRHTTTHRELMQLHSGALLIDTPGMRELGMADHSDGIEETFAEIGELAAQCRFGDCQHESEPGCAIRAALEQRQLDPTRLASYRKLRSEVDDAAKSREKKERSAAQRAYAKVRRK